MKTALVVMLHGSPYPTSNEPALRVVEDVRARGAFDEVVVGYLECNEPSIAEVLKRCVKAGARRIVAVPYFLHFGTHVGVDLPALLDEARQTWPDVEFLMSRYLGSSPLLTDLLAKRAREVLAPREQC
ncbi:MAG: sirohydrochlorin chelatase [Candidatus Sumerlaeaceae bacterium]|jgi:sirohydrochlorin cobaltochelatase